MVQRSRTSPPRSATPSVARLRPDGAGGDGAVGVQRLHPRRSQGDLRVMLEGIDGWDTYFRAGKGAGANAQNP